MYKRNAVALDTFSADLFQRVATNCGQTISFKMSNNDSFQDCDETFSLYSSKKVMDTFKAQLKKIAASNRHLRKPHSTVQDEELNCKIDKNEEIITIKNQQEHLVECTEILNDKTSRPVESNSALDNSVEIVEEYIPRRSTRQSTRLRCKKNLPFPNNNSVNPGRKKGKKGRKIQRGKPVQEIYLDDSPEPAEIDDDLNPEFSVKVIWKSVSVKRFQIRRFQKFSYIFEQLSKEENIPEEKVILTFNNIRVSRNDTPDSLKLQVYHFLDGGVLSELSELHETPESKKSALDDDSIILKFQDVNKKIIKLSLHKNEKFKVAMINYSEQLEIPLSKIKFFFDGELLKPSETPAALDLEGEEVIDIKISD